MLVVMATYLGNYLRTLCNEFVKFGIFITRTALLRNEIKLGINNGNKILSRNLQDEIHI